MRKLYEIAREIRADWKNPYFGAVPYISAMERFANITDGYGFDSAKSIIRYFLSNAGTWRGDIAKRIKLELKGMLK